MEHLTKPSPEVALNHKPLQIVRLQRMENEEISLSASDLENLSVKVTEIESRLARLQTIVRKIDSDAYGKCEACQAEIDLEVLSSNPEASLCAAHAPEPGEIV